MGREFMRNNRGGRRNFGGRRNDNRDNNKSNWKRTEERIEEPAVGICEYISNHKGFTGILKSRFSDFQVNEIDTNNEECSLNDFSIPDPEDIIVADDQEKEIDLTEFMTVDQIKEVENLLAESDESKNVEIDVTDFEKDKRSSMHKNLKLKYGKSVFSNTLDRDDKKIIQIRKKTKFDRRVQRGWQFPHEYTHFVMYKENIDTIQAISALANKLKMKPALLTYSGTKDKRAKTCQWISVKRVEPSKICQAAKFSQGVRVGNFKFLPEPLKLGGLSGNRFRIALRAVNGDQSEIEKGLESLREFGFINYYGLQRFGNCVKVPTFLIGQSLLTENFQEACELILKERDGEPHYMGQMRSIYFETKNPKKALDILRPTNTCVEARLLRGLVKNGEKNFLQALLTLPRNMLMLYTHAYQSYIWNQIASKRRELGLAVIEGDLVYAENTPSTTEVEIIEEDNTENEDEAPEVAAEVVESKFISMVRTLTEDDVKSGKYSIYDIVLPLPGHDIKYPSGSIGTAYEELMAKDNLTSEKLKNKHNVFSLNGAYRKVFIKPQNVDWKFLKYSGQNDLILSDYSKLCGDAEPVNDENGDNLALIVDFVLPPSAYATMALREIMKCDTNVGNHIKMENQLKQKDEENIKKRELEEDVDDQTNEENVKKIKV